MYVLVINVSVKPEAVAALISYDKTVRHCEIVEKATAKK